MSWYPAAIRKEVTRHRTSLTANKCIYHTAVSDGTSLFNYFNQPGNPTSHFYVREDGTVEQYVDTRYQAPANLEGNHCAISIESWDGAGSTSQINAKPWTPAQMDSLVALTAWIAATHGIPLVVIPDSKHDRRGFGYHRQGVDPYRVGGGELWSKAYGKICPGDARISQVPTIVTAAQEDDMTPEEVKTAMREVLAEKRIRLDWDGQDVSFYQAASWIHFNAADGSYVGVVPHTSVRENRRGTDTFGKRVLDKPTGEVDVEALAAELAPLLPGCSQETVEAALRTVLGSLDNPPPPVEPEA